ncbi:MAG: FAD-dependent oxidoreductase [Syntrophorhabdaceae bacterium]|nr:FAD-dependent oxidoreductase [Syntrophorhabdaceae bacterium]
MDKKERLVVIGGVAAGMSAASSFKRLKPDEEAIVLEKGDFISYGACSLPYFISDEIKDFHDLISLTPEIATEERGIKVLLRHEAVRIDTEKRIVHVRNTIEDKELSIPYDKLVLATGAQPIKPPLPGIELYGIFTLRTVNDGINIKNTIDKGVPQNRPMNAVIVGGGYIGMEMCESLRKRGLNVTVIEKTDRVLGTMDLSITGIVEEKIIGEGVRLLKGTSVEGFKGRDGHVTEVVTDKGGVEADIVLLVIGARPNVNIAKEAGITLGAGGAIMVDEYMRTSIEDIYAAGDCAEALHLVTGKKVYIPLGTTANKQGRVAGENAAGMHTRFDGIVGTAVTKIFDLEVARTGLSPVEAEREGLSFFVSTIKGRSRSSACPKGKPITVTYIVEKDTGRLLGAQMAGEEGVAHRIDTLAACLYGKMTVHDVARLDLGYAPPFATVWDPILIGANVALKRLKGA